MASSCSISAWLNTTPRRRSVTEADLYQAVRTINSVRSEELVESEFVAVAFPEVVQRGLINETRDRSRRKASHDLQCSVREDVPPVASL